MKHVYEIVFLSWVHHIEHTNTYIHIHSKIKKGKTEKTHEKKSQKIR